MQRPIKFRGISIDTLKFIYGYGVVVFEEHGCVIIHNQGNNAMQHTSVVPESVSEFVGIKDKHGKEIYEGDILKWESPDKLYPSEDYTEKTGVVHYTECGFSVKHKEHNHYGLFTLAPLSEIIGNLWQNPDFLTK